MLLSNDLNYKFGQHELTLNIYFTILKLCLWLKLFENDSII